MHPFSKRLRAAALALSALLPAAFAQASDLPSTKREPAPPLPALPSLTFRASAYLWATGLEGRLRTLPPLPAAKVSIGFDEVMKHFDGGIMGAGELKYDRWLVFFDVLASKISPNKTIFPAGYPAGVKVDSGSFVGLAAGGYRLIDDPAYSLDAFAGVRGFAMKNTLRVQLMPATLKLAESEQWADGVVGARLKVNLTKSLYATTIGFVGKGGSRYEWDVFGGLGYAFTDKISAFAGYRAMKVDYRSGNFIYNALQQGPVLGVNASF